MRSLNMLNRFEAELEKTFELPCLRTKFREQLGTTPGVGHEVAFRSRAAGTFDGAYTALVVSCDSCRERVAEKR